MNIEDDFSKIALAVDINNRIDAHCVERFNDGHRTHLGASLIGDDCSRKLFYTFRWCKNAVHSGQLYRLFQRGHREEVYLVEYLRAVGFKVSEFEEDSEKRLFEDPNPDGDYIWLNGKERKLKEDQYGCIVLDEIQEGGSYYNDVIETCPKPKPNQYRISDCGGHFGGSMDGLCTLPPELAEKYHLEDEVLLLEFKTINQNGHSGLSKKGMVISKPQHFDQTCTYGLKMNLKYCCYISVNKNTDELYIEIVELDHNVGKNNILKAEYIINAKAPPEKLSQQSTHFKCKMCEFKGICHHDEPLDRNCRSCRHSEAIADKKWKCNKANCEIPLEHIGEEQPCWEGVQ